MAQEFEVRIEFRVHPQAKRSRITGMLGSAYKIDVAAPATDGRANDACVDLLAEITGTARNGIRLLKGQTSRSKVFEFHGVKEEELRRRLDQAI